MNGSADFERVPGWQADRLATLLDALGDVPLSDAERRTLTWLCGFEAHTVEHLVTVIEQAQAMARSKQAARDELETGRLRRQLSEARDEVITRHRRADWYRGNLIDLCLCEGIDPGEDPHAALLAHLCGREPGGGQ